MKLASDAPSASRRATSATSGAKSARSSLVASTIAGIPAYASSTLPNALSSVSPRCTTHATSSLPPPSNVCGVMRSVGLPTPRPRRRPHRRHPRLPRAYMSARRSVAVPDARLAARRRKEAREPRARRPRRCESSPERRRSERSQSPAVRFRPRTMRAFAARAKRRSNRCQGAMRACTTGWPNPRSASSRSFRAAARSALSRGRALHRDCADFASRRARQRCQTCRPAPVKAPLVLRFTIESPGGSRLVVNEARVGNVRDRATLLARAQAEIDVLEAVDERFVKAAVLDEPLGAHRHRRAGDAESLTRAINCIEPGGHIAAEVVPVGVGQHDESGRLGHTVFKKEGAPGNRDFRSIEGSYERRERIADRIRVVVEQQRHG